MNAIRTATVLLSVVLTSCAVFSKKDKDETPAITDTKIVTKTEYLPGKVTVQKVTAPDSSLTKPCERLTGEHIPDGPDILGSDAVKTAAAWGKTANDCRDSNLLLIGWINGVVAASDAPPPEAPIAENGN